MNTIAIIGLQWGDEGKGKIVDWLAQSAQHVVRFQGGHNAGHTLIHGDKKYVLHLLPSGVLNPHARCYIGNGVVISIPDLLQEIACLQAQNISLLGRLFIANNASLVLPYHVQADEIRERQNKIGTTKRGIGPAHEDRIGRRALRFYDLFNGEGKEKLRNNVDFYNTLLEPHGVLPLDAKKMWQQLQEQAESLKPYICDDIANRLVTSHTSDEKILLEGAQGTLLDIEQGTYPYTTSATCLVSAHIAGLGVDLSPTVYGVIKSYCTRVGNGPFPTELLDETGEVLAKRGNEFGSTTNRPRRCGWLDIPLLRHALRINNCRRLIMTKLDILETFENILMCVEYDLDGQRQQFPPSDPTQLKRCLPVYETFPGWKDKPIAGAKHIDALPKNAMAYIQRIEELCDVSVDVIATGAERSSIIVRQSPL